MNRACSTLSVWTEEPASFGVAATGSPRDAGFGDFDGDGRIDLFVSSAQGSDALLHNGGAEHFSDVTAASGLTSIETWLISAAKIIAVIAFIGCGLVKMVGSGETNPVSVAAGEFAVAAPKRAMQYGRLARHPYLWPSTAIRPDGTAGFWSPIRSSWFHTRDGGKRVDDRSGNGGVVCEGGGERDEGRRID